jgi:Cys-rich protein (TIGR01571 family)
MMIEVVVFNLVTLAGPNSSSCLVAGLVVCVAGLFIHGFCRPFLGWMENCSDFVAKAGVASIATCGLSLHWRAADETLIQNIAILSGVAVALWFFFALNPLRLGSQVQIEYKRLKAAVEVQAWSEETIACLSADRIRHLSTYEVSALTELQERAIIEHHRETLIEQPGINLCDLDFRPHALTSGHGFTKQQYSQLGFKLDINDLKSLGFTVAEAQKAGFITTAEDALSKAGFQASEVKSSGCFSPAEVSSVAQPNGDIYWPNTCDWPSPTELSHGGYSSVDAKAIGYTANELKQAGCYSLAELLAVGFSVDQLKCAGYTRAELRLAGVSAAEQFATSDGSVDAIKLLREAGYSAIELTGAQIVDGSAVALWELGYTADDARKVGVPASEIWEIVALRGPRRLADNGLVIGAQVIAVTTSTKAQYAFGKIVELDMNSCVRVEFEHMKCASVNIKFVQPLQWGEHGRWGDGLLACAGDKKSCFFGILCGPKLADQLFARVVSRNVTARLAAGCCWLTACCQCCGSLDTATLILFALYAAFEGFRWPALLLLGPGFRALYLARIRRQIRARDNIRPSCFCGAHEDVILACCCSPCLICQLARHEKESPECYAVCSNMGLEEDRHEAIRTQPRRTNAVHCVGCEELGPGPGARDPALSRFEEGGLSGGP